MIWNPIISMYWSFHTRMVIYEDMFGNRKEKKVTTSFNEHFPKETDSIDYMTYKHILSGGNYERLGTLVLKK